MNGELTGVTKPKLIVDGFELLPLSVTQALPSRTVHVGHDAASSTDDGWPVESTGAASAGNRSTGSRASVVQ